MSNNNKRDSITDNLRYIFQSVVGTLDYTEKFKEQDRVDNRTMAMLSYIIPLIPFIVERNSAYVKFHSNQGMNLFVWYIIVFSFLKITSTGFPPLRDMISFLILLVTLLFISLIVFGIFNTLKDNAREIPIVSKLNLITIVSDVFGK